MSAYSTSTLGVDRRRRLFSSLRSVLPDAQLWDALWLWEREFAETAPFAIADYARRLADQLGSPGSAQSLLDQVTQGIQGSGDGLPDDPIDEMLRNGNGNGNGAVAAPAAAPAAAGASGSTPQDAVFHALLQGILHGAERKEAGSGPALRQHLGTLVGDVSGDARTSLAAYAQGQTEIIAGLSKEEMSGLINSAYVWSCEEFGPSTVDRIFGDAMRSAEGLPEASSFSPRQLF